MNHILFINLDFIPIKRELESTYSLIAFLFDFTLIAGGLFFIIRLLHFRQKLKARKELEKLQARISILRINLKAKIKRRSNAFRTYFAKSITPDEILDRNLNEISELKLETSDEFQKYFDVTKRLQSLVRALPHLHTHPIDSYLEIDGKIELIILRIVKEMHDVSTRYNSKLENFNAINPKVKMVPIDPLQFEALKAITQALEALNEQPGSQAA